MLIRFSVTNFRSIKETQFLSMEASHTISELPDHVSNVELTESNRQKQEHLLKSAVIFGPNASGKSNVVEALGHVGHFIINAARLQRGDEIKWGAPFKLDSKASGQPSVFEIVFVQKNRNGQTFKYEYGFALTSERIIEEWLLEYRSGRPTQLFSREYDPETQETSWHFGGGLKVGDIPQRTLDNVLFLSKAAQENHLVLSQVFDWFLHVLTVLPSTRNNNTIIQHYLKTDFEKRKSRLLRFLSDADIRIVDLQLTEKQLKIRGSRFPENVPDIESDLAKKQSGTKLQSIHVVRDTGQRVEFDFTRDESDGTQALLALASLFMEAADRKQVIVVDELDKNLHPLLIQMLLRAFHNFSKGSQLIFTTHNLHQMDEDQFRKDQIWLMEKDRLTESSFLYCLGDLKGIRKEHAFDRRYLLGAYGALPVLGEFDLRMK